MNANTYNRDQMAPLGSDEQRADEAAIMADHAAVIVKTEDNGLVEDYSNGKAVTLADVNGNKEFNGTKCDYKWKPRIEEKIIPAVPEIITPAVPETIIPAVPEFLEFAYKLNGHTVVETWPHSRRIWVQNFCSKDEFATKNIDSLAAAYAAGCMRFLLINNPRLADHYADRLDEAVAALEMLISHSAKII